MKSMGPNTCARRNLILNNLFSVLTMSINNVQRGNERAEGAEKKIKDLEEELKVF